MRRTILLLTMVAAGLLAFSGVVLAQQGTQKDREQTASDSQQHPSEYKRGEVLVKFKPGTRGTAEAEAHRQNGAQVQRTIPEIEVKVVKVSSGDEQRSVDRYRANPNVEFAEVNGIYRAIEPTKEETTNEEETTNAEQSSDNSTKETTTNNQESTKESTKESTTNDDPTANLTPSDSQAGKQWQYNNTGQTGGKSGADIDAFEAWDVRLGSTSVPIAILDTGIDQNHEDLGSKLAKNKNFTTSGTVDDLYGHGTHVAGSAAALTNNTTGVAGTTGICQYCVLWNYKVLDDNGSGTWDGIASGIIAAANDGAKVINMSLGGYFSSDTVQKAVNTAWGKNVVLAAAAGNDGNQRKNYPAYYPNVIAVAATDHADAKASFSNHGSWVDVAAPGKSILSTQPNHKDKIWGDTTASYGTISGTSMATPHVAGLAGLVWSTPYGTSNTNVRSRIETKADKINGTGNYWYWGRINANTSIR